MAEVEMTLRVRESGSRRNVELETDTSGVKTFADFLKFTRSSLIQIASQALREEQAKGFDKNPVIIVDNKVGKSIDSVSPLGKIEFKARVEVSSLLLSIYKLILERSRRSTGFYAANHVVMLRGRIIARNMDQLQAWINSETSIKESDFVSFVNITPYAGFLEREGIRVDSTTNTPVRVSRKYTSKRRGPSFGKEVRMENGTYFVAARAARNTFKNNARIYFEWTPGSKIGMSELPSADFRGKKLRKTFSPSNRVSKGNYVYPSIVVRFSIAGGTV